MERADCARLGARPAPLLPLPTLTPFFSAPPHHATLQKNHSNTSCTSTVLLSSFFAIAVCNRVVDVAHLTISTLCVDACDHELEQQWRCNAVSNGHGDPQTDSLALCRSTRFAGRGVGNMHWFQARLHSPFSSELQRPAENTHMVMSSMPYIYAIKQQRGSATPPDEPVVGY